MEKGGGACAGHFPRGPATKLTVSYTTPKLSTHPVAEFGGLLGGSGQGSQAQKAPAALPQPAAAAAAALGAPLAGGPLELAAGGGEEEGGDARSDGSASVQEEVGEEEEGEEFADLYELD